MDIEKFVFYTNFIISILIRAIEKKYFINYLMPI